MKVLLVGFTILFAVASPVFAQQAPPPSEKAKQIEALVRKAAAIIDKMARQPLPNSGKRTASGSTGIRTCSSTI
jgi:hypothetical protein